MEPIEPIPLETPFDAALSPVGSNGVERVPSNHQLDSSSLENVENLNPTLWVNVIEGSNFPIHLGGIYVLAICNGTKVTSKSVKHDTDNPHWGEVFVFGIEREAPGALTIKVKASKGILPSSTLLYIHIPLSSLTKDRQYFQWVQGKSEHLESARVLVQIRLSTLPPLSERLRYYQHGHHYHVRLPSLRFELMSYEIRPGQKIRGLVTFSASRERRFQLIRLRVCHGTDVQAETEMTEVQSRHFYFDKELSIPHQFSFISHHYVMSPGFYIWPFEVTFPDTLFATDEFTLNASEGPEMVTTFLKISACIGGKTEEVKLNVSTRDGLPKPNLTRTISSPKIKFLAEAPLMPDDDPQLANDSANGYNCLTTLPSTGISSELHVRFNPSNNSSE